MTRHTLTSDLTVTATGQRYTRREVVHNDGTVLRLPSVAVAKADADTAVAALYELTGTMGEIGDRIDAAAWDVVSSRELEGLARLLHAATSAWREPPVGVILIDGDPPPVSSQTEDEPTRPPRLPPAVRAAVHRIMASVALAFAVGVATGAAVRGVRR